MSAFYIGLGIIASYLIGSIPTSVWLGKAYFGIDVRDYGSGNAGATNTFRVLGKKAGVIVFFVDVLKGWTAASLATILWFLDIVPEGDLLIFKLIFGLCAVLGHIFPIYENFRGGKGVATLLGMGLSLHLEASLLCILIFVVVLIASKYVSLGSIIAALAFPLLLLIPRFNPEEPLIIIFGFAVFALVVFTHQKNIKRIIAGEENKTNLRIRKR